MSSRLLKKYGKFLRVQIPLFKGMLRQNILTCECRQKPRHFRKMYSFYSAALESAVRTADTSAVEVYWDPEGYSNPSRLWCSRICAAMESMAGAISGYMVSTESLKGTRETERIPVRSTVTSTLTFSLPKTMGDE